MLRPWQHPSLTAKGPNDRISSVRPLPARECVAEAGYGPMSVVAQDFRRGRDDVGASSIKVETLNGTVMLSGFAKNTTERSTAETTARHVTGVRSVRNEIALRP